MEFKRGRLIDHIHLRVRDLEQSKAFYRALFCAMALVEGPGFFHADKLWEDQADADRPKIQHQAAS